MVQAEAKCDPLPHLKHVILLRPRELLLLRGNVERFSFRPDLINFFSGDLLKRCPGDLLLPYLGWPLP